MRGFGLGTTLIVVALVATLGIFLGELCVTHLGLMSRDSNQACAGDMARRAIAQGIASIFQDKTFGTPGHPSSLSVPPTDVPDGSTGLLSFDPTQAATWGIPQSTNNLGGTGSAAGANGRVVPLAAADLVAVGQCRGVTRQIEVILDVPPYPWAIASDGPILSAGQLQVGASLATPVSAGTMVSQLQPAGLLSNAPGTSINLGPNCQIQGKLQSVGTALLDPSTTVSGQVLNGQSPQVIPNINVASLDPSIGGQPVTTLTNGLTTLTGRLKASSDVHIPGNVTLQGGLVYVAGNLTVDGGINGTGLVATTGNLTVGSQVQMTASDQLAIVCGGQLSIVGRGSGVSSVRGLLYAEGGLQASQLDLEGGLIAHQASGGPLPTVQLDQCYVVQVSDLTRFSFPVGLTGAGTTSSVGECGQMSGPPAPSSGPPITCTINRQPDGTFVATGQVFPGNLTFSVPMVAPPSASFPDLASLSTGITPALQAALAAPPINVGAPPNSPLNIYPLAFLPALGDPTQQTGSAYTSVIYTIDPSLLVPVAQSTRITFWGEQ